MKSLILVLSLLSAGAFANASLECSEKNETYSVGLSDDAWGDKFETFYDNCQTAVFEGSVCFRGKRSDVIDLIANLGLEDFLGDEYAIEDIHYSGRKGISYEVYDGPNELTATENTIFPCN